jgi:Fur family transcriptional regulator, iron response regulator
MDITTAKPWIELASQTFFDDEAPVEASLEAVGEDLYPRDCADLLRRAGLRPTRQRVALGELLFSNGGRHVTAEMLHAEVSAASVRLSLATVYNTLHQFTEAGLLRQIGVDGSKSFFDSNPSAHQHFFVDQENRLFDVPEPGILVETLPDPLPGYEISRVDVIVHLRRKQA